MMPLRRGTYLFRFMRAWSIALAVIAPVLVLLSVVIVVRLFAGSAGPGHADVTLSNTPFPWVVPLFVLTYPGVAVAELAHVDSSTSALFLVLAIVDVIFWCVVSSALIGLIVAAVGSWHPTVGPAR